MQTKLRVRPVILEAPRSTLTFARNPVSGHCILHAIFHMGVMMMDYSIGLLQGLLSVKCFERSKIHSFK